LSGGAPTNPRPGDTIAERYRVIEEIGSGGMGAVFRVEHTMMAKEMAMKLLRPELSGIAEVAERFEREAKSAARLDHHHIVRVTDFGKTETGALFLVMELLEGQALTTLLGEQGRIDPNEALLMVDQILEALEHAHGHGVIHRDLKPDNVMLIQKDGRRLVKLLDFGLAKITETKLEDGKQLTTAGTVFGTPRYMSPEQCSGEPTDHRSDLYSVGVMLYELVAGKPPFAGASTVDVLRLHLTAEPPPLDTPMDFDQRAKIEEVIHRVMKKAPKDRFQKAAEFREALLGCLVGADPAVLEKTQQRQAEARFQSITLDPPRARRPIPMRLIGGAAASIAAVGILVTALIVGGGAAISDIDEALDGGDIPRAEQTLAELRENDPNDPRVPLYEGHLAYAKNDLNATKEAYARALANPELSVDARFEANVLDVVKARPKAGDVFVKMIAENGGPSTASVLAKVFDEAPNSSTRKAAYEGVARLDAIKNLRDPVGTLAGDLKNVKTKNCSLRKWYVERLVEFDDPRVLDALEGEQGRRGNFLQQAFGGGVNRCMGGLIETEIVKRRS
jgi:tRNA A-37 threonylcarbamoyl transferase component Bud32